MIVHGACGALQLGCNSLSISSRGSHGLRDHPGFSGLYAPSVAPFPLTSQGLCLPGDNLCYRWMGLRKSPARLQFVSIDCVIARPGWNVSWMASQFGKKQEGYRCHFLHFIFLSFFLFYLLIALVCLSLLFSSVERPHNIFTSILYFSILDSSGTTLHK